ncbi:MAG: glycoside hydrolase family 31 protein, partial [Balneolaceae bacterium]|nr:glycoside hydrolase family 31 protein [Balneolaceae bacterium]
LFRTHSMGFNVDGAAVVNQDEVEKEKSKELAPDQEPWSFGDKATAICRQAINLRYRLLHYLYTAFRRYCTDGTPLLTPMVYYDPSDKEARKHQDEFIFGDHLLVSPVLEKGQKKKKVYLPEGEWYHFWDNARLEGRNFHRVKAPLERIPIFVKAGALLPMRELMQYTGEREPEKLTLLAYHDHRPPSGSGPVESELYEDAGEGYGYREGDYLHTRYRYEGGPKQMKLTASREGSYEPSYGTTELILIGLPFEPDSCTVDGREAQPERIAHHGRDAWQLTVDPGFDEIVVGCAKSGKTTAHPVSP